MFPVLYLDASASIEHSVRSFLSGRAFANYLFVEMVVFLVHSVNKIWKKKL